jgi:hypothetical protein
LQTIKKDTYINVTKWIHTGKKIEQENTASKTRFASAQPTMAQCIGSGRDKRIGQPLVAEHCLTCSSVQ